MSKQQILSVIAIVSTVLTAAGCSKVVPSGITVPETFSPWIDPGAATVAGFNLENLRSSQLYGKYKDDLALSGLDQFVRELGVDPRRDVKQVLYVAGGKTQYFLVQGNFRSSDLAHKLQSKGLTASSYKGLSIIGNAQNSLAPLEESLVVLGPIEGVHAAIDTKRDGRGKMPEEIADRLGGMRKGDQLWVVSRAGLPFASGVTRTDVRSALSNIVAFITAANGSIGADDGLHLQATLRCAGAEGATRVHDALRGTVAIGRLSTKDSEASLLKVYDAIQIERKETNVDVHAQLAGDQVAELVKRYLRR